MLKTKHLGDVKINDYDVRSLTPFVLAVAPLMLFPLMYRSGQIRPRVQIRKM